MRLYSRPFVVFTLVLFGSLQLVAQTAAGKKAIDVFRDFQVAAGKATSITPVLPFLTKEYQRNLQGAPKASQESMFESFKRNATWRDVIVTKETIKGNTCELETTGKDPDGTAMVGKIAFVKEGGEWKIEGQGWVTDYSKNK